MIYEYISIIKEPGSEFIGCATPPFEVSNLKSEKIKPTDLIATGCDGIIINARQLNYVISLFEKRVELPLTEDYLYASFKRIAIKTPI